MVDSVGTFASDQYNTALVLQTKNNLDNLLTQITSGKKSQDFTGIAPVAQQTLDFGNQNASLGNFLTNNNIVNLRLQAMTQVYSSVQSEMSNFQQDLQNFVDNSQSGTASDQNQLQQQAFTALKNMQYYLNTQVDGQYIFSGSKTDTPPFNFNFTSLQQFQQAFDGYNNSFPTTGAADLSNTTTSVLNTGSISFNALSGTISAANTGQFANLPVGSVVNVAGSPFAGQYTVLANDGTNLTVSHGFTAEGNPNAAPPVYAPQVSISTSTQATQDPGVTVNPDGVYFSAPGVMTSEVAGQLSQLHAGDSITISGSASNDGNYIVSNVDPTGTYLSVQRAPLTSPATLDPSVNPDTVASLSYPTGTSSATLTDPVNGVNFNANGTISDNVGGTLLGNVPVGSYITVAGAASASNNGTYLVTANNAGVLSVQDTVETSLNNEANSPATLTNGTPAVFTPGGVNFDAATSTMTAANPGSLSALQVGQTLNVAGSASNNGNFTVTAVFNTPVVTEANNANADLADGTNDFPGATTGGLAFDAATNTITATNAVLGNIQVGDVVSVSGSASNNGSFVVTANNGTTLTLAPPGSAVQAASSVSLSTSSYYAGNSATLGQEIDNNTQLNYGITASNPAFEKAIRAMALIAEGQTGTAGGLDMNASRAQAANYLVTSALDNSAQGTPPFGTESSSNMSDLSLNLDLQNETLNNVTTQQTNFQNFLTTAVGQLTNADSTQSIVQLLDQQSALQASYQALSTVRQLSLLNYLK